MEKITVIIETTRTGYSAYTEQYPGCTSYSPTIPEIKQNFTEAIEFHFEGMKEDGEPVPERYTLEFVEPDENHFLEYLKSRDFPYEEMKPEELKAVRESLGYARFALSKAIDELTGSIKDSIKNILPKN